MEDATVLRVSREDIEYALDEPAVIDDAQLEKIADKFGDALLANGGWDILEQVAKDVLYPKKEE